MFGFFVTGCTRLDGDTTGDATGDTKDAGAFLKESLSPP